jgi:hypothetical protein
MSFPLRFGLPNIGGTLDGIGRVAAPAAPSAARASTASSRHPALAAAQSVEFLDAGAPPPKTPAVAQVEHASARRWQERSWEPGTIAGGVLGAFLGLWGMSKLGGGGK